MKHRTFFWFFLPTGLAMLLFIAAPIVSVVMQSVFAPHEAVLIEVESCTPLSGCTIETSIDQDATRALRESAPLGRFVGLDVYLDRGHLAVAEFSEAWATCCSCSKSLTESMASCVISPVSSVSHARGRLRRL